MSSNIVEKFWDENILRIFHFNDLSVASKILNDQAVAAWRFNLKILITERAEQQKKINSNFICARFNLRHKEHVRMAGKCVIKLRQAKLVNSQLFLGSILISQCYRHYRYALFWGKAFICCGVKGGYFR